MFLKHLYKHNRWFFVLMVTFIIGQAYVNMKRGAVVSPFYHYGMYSNVMSPEGQYSVLEVTVNGNLLQGKNFSPWQWDKVMQPLVYYANISQSNNLYNSEIKRIFSSFRLSTNDKHFIQSVDRDTFFLWYKAYVSTIVRTPVKTISVSVRQYIYNGKALQPSNTLQPL